MPPDPADPAALFDRVSLGWSVRAYRGRRYGVTRTVSAGGRIEKLFAEELGGTDVISANLYLGQTFRPCEMPAEKVMSFLAGSTPVPSAQVDGRRVASRHGRRGHLAR